MGDYSSKRIRDTLPNTRFLWTYHGLALLLKGTPIILYGDELEFKRMDLFMKWDNTNGCGFTNSSTILRHNCTNSVKHGQADGSDTSLLRMYEQLVKLRTSEPSFKWGGLNANSADQVNVVSYVREANRFDGFLVVGNLDESKHLVDFKARHDLPDEATVEYYHAADGVKSGDFSKSKARVRLDNMLVKSGDFLVLRFSREVRDSEAESSGSVGGHG